LATGRSFILGDQPGLPDLLVYYLVWFLRGRWSEGEAFLGEFPAIDAWRQRILAIGHGRPEEMTPEDALETARAGQTSTPRRCDPADRLRLELDMSVGVKPDGDGGDPAVVGQLHYLDNETIAISRDEADIGEVVVHFPRVGYRITRIP
ncbi:MAG: glutathione S-transferase family protein, partial [Geminicoccaceae bacterium]